MKLSKFVSYIFQNHLHLTCGKEICFWHVRLIKGDKYLPNHNGWILINKTNKEETIQKQLADLLATLDVEKGGEFEGYELTYETIELANPIYNKERILLAEL